MVSSGLGVVFSFLLWFSCLLLYGRVFESCLFDCGFGVAMVSWLGFWRVCQFGSRVTSVVCCLSAWVLVMCVFLFGWFVYVYVIDSSLPVSNLVFVMVVCLCTYPSRARLQKAGFSARWGKYGRNTCHVKRVQVMATKGPFLHLWTARYGPFTVPSAYIYKERDRCVSVCLCMWPRGDSAQVCKLQPWESSGSCLGLLMSIPADT